MSRAQAWLVHRLGVSRAAAALGAVGLGTTAAARCPLVPLVVSLASAVLLAAALSVANRTRSLVPWAVLAVSFLIGLSLGAVRTHPVYEPRLAPWLECSLTAEVVVVGPVRSQGEQATALVEVVWARAPAERTGGGERRLPGGDRLLLEWRPATAAGEVVEGAILRVRGRLVTPRPQGSDGYDQAAFLRTQGVALRLLARPNDVAVAGHRRGIAGGLDAIRTRARRHLDRGLPPPWADLLRGVVLGDTAEIPNGLRDAFRRSGTAHILSVSGLHVASLAAAVALTLRVLPFGRLARLLLTLSTLAVFAALTGARPSVVRAAIMLALCLVARDLGRARDRAQIIMVAAVFILIRNPFALFDPGAQLSFAAVVGLAVLSAPVERRLTAVVPESVAAGLAVSLAATMATAPLTLAHFGQVSLVAVPANLLVVPVVTPVMVLGLASMALGFAWPPLCSGLNTVSGVLLGWIAAVVSLCAQAPVLGSHRAVWVAAALLGGAGAMGGGLFALGRLEYRAPPFRPGLRVSPRVVAWSAWIIHRGPGRSGAVATPVRAARRRAGVGLTALALAGSLAGVVALSLGTTAHGALARAWSGRSWPNVPEVRVLDVGEGSATLVRTPGRHAVLIDAGPEACSLAGQLRSLGVGRLDMAIVSHPHADHFGGLRDIRGEVDVERLVDGTDPDWLASCTEASTEAFAYVDAVAGLRESGASTERAGSGVVARVDGVAFEFFGPARPPGTGWDAEELNASSLVVRVQAAGVAVLLPGDAEASVLSRYRLPAVDAVVVPHHGSRDGLNPSVLDALDPRIGVISVGVPNPFGHPSTETLAVLQAAGVPTLRTDISGWVAIRPGVSGPAVLAERGRP